MSDLRPGHQARRVGQLRGIVFKFVSAPWQLADAEVTGTRQANLTAGGTGLAAVITLRLDLVPVPGLRHRINKRHQVEILELPGEAANVDQVWLPWRDTGAENWVRVDLADHHPICGTCQLLWPCRHQTRLISDRRAAAMARLGRWCAHCGGDTSCAMTIEFPTGHSDGLDSGPPALVLVTAHTRPGELPPRPEVARDRSVWFHGRRGPCENAAYRYADRFGWALPPKNQGRSIGERSWHITAHRPDRPTTGDDRL